MAAPNFYRQVWFKMKIFIRVFLKCTKENIIETFFSISQERKKEIFAIEKSDCGSVLAPNQPQPRH